MPSRIKVLLADFVSVGVLFSLSDSLSLSLSLSFSLCLYLSLCLSPGRLSVVIEVVSSDVRCKIRVLLHVWGGLCNEAPDSGGNIFPWHRGVFRFGYAVDSF